MSSIRLSLLVITLCSVAVNLAYAEEYTEYTNGSPTTPGSSIGFIFNFANITTSNVDPSPISSGSFLVVDQNLNASNTGTLYVTGGELHQQDFSITSNVNPVFLGSLTYTGSGLKYSVSIGPIAVGSGNYLVNSSTVGTITLNGGTLHMEGPFVGQYIDSDFDFSVNPVTFSFASLGMSSLTGHADGNAAGVDSDTDSHSSNIPGTTGLNIVDTDGAELLLNLNGLTGASTLTSGTLSFPISITLTGSVYVSVPEVNSLTLMAGSLCGFGLLWLRRSKV